MDNLMFELANMTEEEFNNVPDEVISYFYARLYPSSMIITSGDSQTISENENEDEDENFIRILGNSYEFPDDSNNSRRLSPLLNLTTGNTRIPNLLNFDVMWDNMYYNRKQKNSKDDFLKKYILKPDIADITKQEICSICFEDFVGKNKSISDCCQLPCSHCFHTKCVSEWYVEKKTCPLCRETLVCEQSITDDEEQTNINRMIENLHNPPVNNNNTVFERINDIIREIYSPIDDNSNSILYHQPILAYDIQIDNNSDSILYHQPILAYDIQIRLEIIDYNKYAIFKDNSTVANWTLEKSDVELVMSQTSCELEMAIRSLINNEGDIVNAIMELAM